MRSRLIAARRLFHILLLTALLTGACYWHWGLLPGALKSIPIEAIREATGFEAGFDRVHYIPFHGIRIGAPILKDKDGRELFRADSIRLATDIPSFIQEDRIVIRKIEVDSPVTEIRLARPEPSGGENTESQAATPGETDDERIVPLQSASPHPFIVLEAVFDDSFLPSNVYLNELEIRHGRISLLPPAGTAGPAGERPIETLREVRFNTKLDQRPRIPVVAEFRTGFGRGNFRAEGLVDLSDAQHRLLLRGNLDRLPEWLAPVLEARGVRIDRLRGDAQLALVYDGESLITFRAESKRSSVRGAAAGRDFEGDFSVRTAGTFDFTTAKFELANGAAEAAGVTIKGLAGRIDEVRLSSAAVTWNPERIEFPRIQGSWENTHFTIDGGIGTAPDRPARFTFRHSLRDLGPLEPFAARIFEHPLNLGSLKGDLRIEAALEGPAAELLRNVRSVRVDIRDGSLAPRFLKSPMTGIAGTVLIEPLHVFSTRDLFFRQGGNDYTLGGQFNSLPGGAGRFDLSAPKWDAGARFKSWPDRVEFSTFTLQSGASHIGATGILRLGDRPSIHADFRTRLVPDELAADWHARAPWLKNLKLTGNIDAEGSVRGPMRDFAGLRMNVKARSARLTYDGRYTVDPIETDLRLDSGVLELIYAKAGLYGGEARATGHADLTDWKRPYFETHVFTQDTDLARFSREMDFIKNKFSGFLDLDLTLSGVMNDVRTLKGHGSFKVGNGELWQTELFKRLKKVLFVTIEGADKVVFNRASGSFTVGNGGVETRDCTLSSKLIDVHFNGRIGFDAAIAMDVISRFTSGIIREASEVGGLTPALINLAENKITRYQVSGTLKEPAFTPKN